MSSEAITQNDLREILSRTVGAVPSEYKKLLWTNASPTSAFSAQTVSLNLTGYDEVEIEARNSTSNSDSVTQNFSISSGGGILTIYQLNDTWYMRQLTISNSGITFASGRYCYMSNGGNGVLDAVCVPQKIYGIKYERVAPPQVEFPNYSTEEQQVGTWIDGKPIYRKVINVPSLTAGLNTITAPSNIDTFVTLRGMEKESGGAQAPIPKAHYSAFAYQIGMYYSGGNIYIEVGSNLTYITSACVICEYTKTTD